MTNNIRKRLGPLSVVATIAVLGVLAAFIALSVVSSTAEAQGPPPPPPPPAGPPAPPPPPATMAPTMPPMMGANHATMPQEFWLEGLDNGARLSWHKPKDVREGAEVVGYRIHRDAWNPDPAHPINDYGDATFTVYPGNVLAASHSDRGLAYETVYTYQVQALVRYSNNSGYYNAAVAEWWDSLDCREMNDVVEGHVGDGPAIGPDNMDSPYCAMYDDLSDAAKAVVKRAYSAKGYNLGALSYMRSIETADSGGLLDALLAPPSAPQNVMADPSCDDQITVKWDAPADLGKVPAEFPGCATCSNRTPIHHGGTQAGIEVQPGTAMITGYMVERKVGDGMWETIATNVTGMSYIDDDDLMYGEIYHYRVRATNNANLTGPAGMVIEDLKDPDAPGRPSSLVVNLEQDLAIFELQWDPPEDPHQNWRTEDDFKEAIEFRSRSLSYLVERQIDDGDWESVLMPSATLREGIELVKVTINGKDEYALRHEYSREGLNTVRTQEHRDDTVRRTAETQQVRYRVSALINACKPSPWNQADEVELPAETPVLNAPSNVMVTNIGGGSIQVDWTGARHAAGYVIYAVNVAQAADPSGAHVAAAVNRTSPTTWNLVGLTVGDEYDIYVVATASGMDPEWSDAMRMTPQ